MRPTLVAPILLTDPRRPRHCGANGRPPRLRLCRCAAPGGGTVRALGRPCGTNDGPARLRLRRCAAPEGEQFAPWDGPAARMVDPTLAALPLRCPRRGSSSRLGTALRRELI